MKCLIIDDDEFLRDYVATLLDGIADCHQAAGGSEAVACFKKALEEKAPYDLLIMDIMMPDMNGHEAAKAIRAVEKQLETEVARRVKIVMLTSLNSPQDAMESFCSAQSAAYIVKPIAKEKLFDVIGKLGLLKK